MLPAILACVLLAGAPEAHATTSRGFGRRSTPPAGALPQTSLLLDPLATCSSVVRLFTSVSLITYLFGCKQAVFTSVCGAPLCCR